ncbi:ATP-dependent helicase/deoxyribonuclease subunit B [Planctomycetes bacterium MalM25]|nr:ATP-dependent helicase/deoxyribonuclease subunit B [Planctomycetes bacterium MalM25]
MSADKPQKARPQPDRTVHAVVGDPAERREAMLRFFRGDAGPPVSWWLAPTPAAVGSIRRARLHAGEPGRLPGGVMTLRQAATTLTRDLPPKLPLTPAARHALIAEFAALANHRDALGPLEELIESPGLVAFLASRFRELRREGITANEAPGALARSEGRAAGSVLARLYRDYLGALGKHDLLDDEGVVLAAIEATPQSPAAPQRLLLDLSADLAPIDSRLVQALAARAEEIVVALPGDAPGVRAWWVDLLGVDDHALESGAGPTQKKPAALVHVREHLFEDSPPQFDNTAGVRVLAGDSAHDTARRVARRVKRLLVEEGVRPHEVVLAAPRLDASWPRYREALVEAGVPCSVDAAPRLSSAGLWGAVVDLLALASSDGAFEPLLALLGRTDLPALDADKPPERFASPRAATEWFVRELQVPSGAKYLRRQAEALASLASPSERLDRLGAAANAAVGLFERLDAAFEALPEEGTPLEWFDALDAAFKRLGHPGLTNSGDETDRAAGDALEEAAASIDGLTDWRGRAQRRIRRRGMLELLRSWGQQLRLPRRDASEGRVRIVGAPTATGLACRHLIVIDADESAFAADSGDATAAMLQFRELCATPSEGLAFAYAALDDAAQPLLPSPYVTEVERLFADGAPRLGEPPLLAPFDPGQPATSRREQRLAAVADAEAGESGKLSSYSAIDGGALLNSLAAIDARARGEAFGPWEGVFAGAAGANSLGERYGPEHLWSASQLELMATCPYKFFARHGLMLDEAGELALGVDHRRRGRLMHDALAECLTAIAGGLPAGQTLRDVPPDELSERLAAQIDTLCDTGKLPQHEAALAAIEARQTHDWAALYAEQQRKFHDQQRWSSLDTPLTPTLLEVRFGPATADDGAEDQRSTDRVFELTLPGGEVLKLTGRIDRIDTARRGEQTLFSVIDYKTSKQLKSTRDQIEQGEQLQPVLYALAAQELLLDDAVPVAAGYWGVRQKGFVAPSDRELPLVNFEDGRVQPSDEWNEVVDAVRHRCEQIVHDVRHGAFPMHNRDEHCGERCEYKTVCRVAQARSLGKAPATEGGES